MAKFTETLYDYLEGGGVLPSSSFALIPDFEGYFMERYSDCEIGFETDGIFAVKLDLKARVVMPLYAKRLNAITNALAKLETPNKVRTETRRYGKQHSKTKSDGKNTDLPFDADTSKPSALSHLEGSADVDCHEDNYTITDYVTIDENLRILEAMESRRRSIYEECLDEFKPLFMGVY